jgi:hypothetical protein
MKKEKKEMRNWRKAEGHKETEKTVKMCSGY